MPISIKRSVSSLMVHESVPARTLQELIAYARANPGTLSYGSAGPGTRASVRRLFKTLAGLPDIVHVLHQAPLPGWRISSAAISRS